MTEEEYIGIVGEIFDGYTEIIYQNKPVFIKHFSIRDQRYIHRFYNKYKNIAQSRGIPTEEEMLLSLLEEGIWTDDDDLKIINLEQELEGLRNSQRAALLPSQKKAMQKSIEEKKHELLLIKSKKNEILGQTAEVYGYKRSNEEFIRYLIYEDPQCKKHLFSDQQFSELSEEEVVFFVKNQEEISSRLRDENIQQAVLRDFFNMYMSQTEDIAAFYGKAIIDLTAFQLKLGLYSRVFFNIFQYNEEIPERIKKDPQAIFDFIDTKKGSSKLQQKLQDSGNGGAAIFNATAEDLDLIDPNAKKLSLSDELSKKGGSMNMDDLINLMG